MKLKNHKYSNFIRTAKEQLKARFHKSYYSIEYTENKMEIQTRYIKFYCTFSYNEHTIYYRFGGPENNKGHFRTLGDHSDCITEIIEELYQFHKKIDGIRYSREG